MPRSFLALFAQEPDGTKARIAEVEEDVLDPGDVLIEVSHSSLNYKDALAITGRAPVVRRFPMICGIDLVGRVIAAQTERVRVGELVVVTGCGLGEEQHGGLAGLARVHGEWCVPLPPTLDSHSAMAIGTAGVTAMLAVMALERNGLAGLTGDDLPVLVTGAAGGVGSLAVVLLSKSGYRVLASTGRLSEADYLRRLGASEVIERSELEAAPVRPLARERFSGVVDVVGGIIAAQAIAATRQDGTVALCGLAGGSELSTSVYPFILRGVNLAGINSVHVPAARREQAWSRLAELLSVELLGELSSAEPLERAPMLAEELLAGHIRGRVVIEIPR